MAMSGVKLTEGCMTTYQVIFYACFTLPCPPLTKKESCRYENFKERKFAKKNVLFMKLLTFFWLGGIKKRPV